MSLWRIAWRSMGQRGLASILTGLSMALGVALVVVVLVVYGVLDAYFMRGAQGYNLIVGAKGSKQQLVFNTVYHLDQPIENIPYHYYKEFVDGQFASRTRLAIPYCLGDSYHASDQTFRVVGTTPDLLDKIEYGRSPDGTAKRYTIQRGGRNFRTQNPFEAVIGCIVAHETGLGVGDTFRPAHGIVERGAEAHVHDAFTIVGVIEPTGTPNDRAMFVNIEGFYRLEGHTRPNPDAPAADLGGVPAEPSPLPEARAKQQPNEHDAGNHAEGPDRHSGRGHGHAHVHGDQHEPIPEGQRQVTAILVLVTSPMVSQWIHDSVNKGPVAQAVYPVREITRFVTTFLAPVHLILLVLTVLIVVVAGIGILVSIYNSMNERRHEIAVMRALGASRRTVMAVIIMESILLSFMGGMVGLAVGHGILTAVSPYVVERTGVSIGFLQYNARELVIIPALVVLASLVGLLPAMAAYRTDVAKALGAAP